MKHFSNLFNQTETTPLESTEAIPSSDQLEQTVEKLQREIDFKKLEELCGHLCDAITDMLNSCGFYFRIFSRVKSPVSIAKKLQRGNYGTFENPKKIQDLIGLRIVLYYFDDMSILREITESTFEMIDDWSRPRFKTNEFMATKTNGVFRFPQEYLKHYTKKPWNFPIDTTFELQLRTVFFEGWHEIEHDMRYKSMLSDHEFWKGSEELSRILNCILANLELSDWALVKLFDELSYNHYKSKNWDLMLKSKYRLRINNEEPLYPEIIELFNEDSTLAKAFFKAERKTLIKELLKAPHPQISYNLIVRLLNKCEVKNAKLTEFFEHTQWSETETVRKKSVFAPLDSNILFRINLPLLHKETRNLQSEFLNSVNILYKWVCFKFSPIFQDLPMPVSSCCKKQPGFEIEVDYKPDQHYFSMRTSSIDDKYVGTILQTETSICLMEDQKLHFSHITSRNTPRGVSHPTTFRKPSFLNELSNKIGLMDVVRLGSKAKFVADETIYDELIALIHDQDRQLPVIVITQNPPEIDEEMTENEDWEYDMTTFTINGTRLAKVIGHYCHVYMTDYLWNGVFANACGISKTDADGCIAIFWKGKILPRLYTRQIVSNTQFDFNRFAFQEGNIYEKAFRHKLVQIIKDNHVISIES